MKKTRDILLHYYSIRDENDIPGMLKTVRFARYLIDTEFFVDVSVSSFLILNSVVGGFSLVIRRDYLDRCFP
ncbi:MAG: hypothetical protein OXD49_02350 [Candidatus Poribacteria bacterium]|nr:hypothetical protein [Candidatus Poribacteria bacterium]